MTVRLEAPGIGDKILALAGKKRALTAPADAYRTFGPYVSVIATREPFFKALFRSKGQPPPPGWFYPDDIFLIESDHD